MRWAFWKTWKWISTMSIPTPETAGDPADMAGLAEMAKSLFAALPTGAVNPALAGAPETPVSDLPLSDDTLPHYSDGADAGITGTGRTARPWAVSGRPVGPPQAPQLNVLALGLDIPCEGGPNSQLPPQQGQGNVPALNLGTGQTPAGFAAPAYGADNAFYFLKPAGAPAEAPKVAPATSPSLPVASASGFDARRYRKDFPILSEIVNGKPLVWLDNAATTQKPHAVIDRLSHFYAHENSNIHRAAHELAARATDAYEAARESVRRFLNAPSTDNIVFVRGTTEAINLVAQSWGRASLGPGDEVIVTHLEHHANIVPWVRLAEELGFKLKVAPVSGKGEILIDDYARLLNDRVKLVSFTRYPMRWAPSRPPG